MNVKIKDSEVKKVLINKDINLCRALILHYKSKIKKNNNFLVKDKNGRKIYRFTYNENSYYAKHYNKISFLRKSKAIKAFEKIKRLKKSNIEVVKPILALEYNNRTSLLITEEFGKNNLLDTLAKKNLDFSLKRKLITKYADIISDLYNNNYLHKDPNLESISIKFQNESNLKIALVDIDEIISFPYLPKFLIKKNLVKINAHSYAGLYYKKYNNIDFKDRLYFLNKLSKTYNRNLSLRRLLFYVKNETIKILKKWNKYDILEDEF